MKDNLKTVLKENIENRYRIFRLAIYEMKNQYQGTVFGLLWSFISPIMQIAVYWFVFSVGLKSGKNQGDYPYIVWMIIGIIPWFYISSAMSASANAIYAYSNVLKRMYIPLSIVPTKTVLASFFSHISALLVGVGTIVVMGYSINSLFFQIVYYMICSLFFLAGYGLIASAITVVFKDFQRIMTSVIRLLFYISPILWVQDGLSNRVKLILSLNPIAYIINGYRDSLLYGTPILENWEQGIYFWILTSVLFIIGCNVHMKFRKKFIDLL